MPRKRPTGGHANYGIQADRVTADVLAVGERAKATKTVGVAGKEIGLALNQLREGIATASIDPAVKEAVMRDLDDVQSAVAEKRVDKDQVKTLLDRVAERLKSVGVVLSEASSLVEPIKKIATLVGIGLSLIG